ncbi:MAG: hypothetical protein ACF8NJ_03850 [Phycisphaerales bacterium JB038]
MVPSRPERPAAPPRSSSAAEERGNVPVWAIDRALVTAPVLAIDLVSATDPAPAIALVLVTDLVSAIGPASTIAPASQTVRE